MKIVTRWTCIADIESMTEAYTPKGVFRRSIDSHGRRSGVPGEEELDVDLSPGQRPIRRRFLLPRLDTKTGNKVSGRSMD